MGRGGGKLKLWERNDRKREQAREKDRPQAREEDGAKQKRAKQKERVCRGVGEGHRATGGETERGKKNAENELAGWLAGWLARGGKTPGNERAREGGSGSRIAGTRSREPG